MKLKDDTTQAHDVAVRAADVVVVDGPVGVDTAMRRCAAMYLGATGRDMRRLQALDPHGTAWWRKVRTLAAHG